MNCNELIKELDDVVLKMKMKILYYQTENANLRKRINELKKYVKEK
tara:strand:- start:219 stop:356 length:138 start_codon:yes stop_codon:yes gene_type:complete